MKFGLHLTENLVPEWRDQYLDYKEGKKELKKLAKSVEKTPRSQNDTLRRRNLTLNTPSGFVPSSGMKTQQERGFRPREPSLELPPPALPETAKFGSPRNFGKSAAASGYWKSPEHALSPSVRKGEPNANASDANPEINDRSPLLTSSKGTPVSRRKSFAEIGSDLISSISRRGTSIGGFTPRRAVTGTEEDIYRLHSISETSEQKFIKWVDGQVQKIEKFYVMKEKEASERYVVLKNQLEVMQKHRAKTKSSAAESATDSGEQGGFIEASKLRTAAQKTKDALYKNLEIPTLPELFRNNGNFSAEDGSRKPGQGIKRDYARKSKSEEYSVPYPIAKRQLKTALSEFYRSLELLKGYRALNITAVRKIMKKFDKTVGSQLADEYMNQVRQNNDFAKSDILDDLAAKTENLYSTYFENGNRKNAIEKLRAKEIQVHHYGAIGRTGLFLGAALPLFIEAIYTGVKHLDDPAYPNTRYLFQIWAGFFMVNLMLMLFLINLLTWTSYKINYPFIFEFDPRDFLDYQQYGEIPAFCFFVLSLFAWLTFNDFWPDTYPDKYFPPIYLGLMFLVVFLPLRIFHYTSRKWLLVSLWRLLLSGLYPVEFRDFFLGDIFCSLNYSLSSFTFFFCLYATHWRFNPFEGHVVSKCSSSKSRLNGFFNTLPGVWRFLQCIRRYSDTGDWFPHLANAGKYTCLILYYMFLSMARIDRSSTVFRALFIVFATINAVYSSFWDILMDFSLGQPGSKYPLLRNELSYKSPLPYYTVMVIDPILRCAWIFYAIFWDEIEQSYIVSFFVSLVEVMRRFIWVFFRVENEHGTNVVLFRASRDLTLPYSVPEDIHSPTPTTRSIPKVRDEEAQIEGSQVQSDFGTFAQGPQRSAQITAQSPLQNTSSTYSGSPTARERFVGYATPVILSVSSAIRSAHRKDFERRKPGDISNSHENEDDDDDDEEDDDDDDDEDDSNKKQENGDSGDDTMNNLAGPSRPYTAPGTSSSSNNVKTKATKKQRNEEASD